jgi:hypothetical protein
VPSGTRRLPPAAEPKFRRLARNPLGERVPAAPAVADNRLYARVQRNLFCIAKL